MGKTTRLTNEEFINRAKQIHGDKYDYSKVNYVNNKTKVCIICHEKDEFDKEHGEFWQLPNNHLKGHGCPKCNGKCFEKKYYIEKAKIIHKGKYDYSKSDFKNVTDKATIICPIHGEFKQAFNMHLLGQGCKKCYGNEKMTKEEFLNKAKKIHNDKYDYSKIELTGNNKSYVTITCKKHGDFKQKINCHLNGDGCPKCSKKHKYTTEEFIKEAKYVHGDKYDYSKVEYINNHTKVCVICPTHGEFFVKPNNHLSSKNGCPYCRTSYLEEKICKHIKNDFLIERRKHFKWLGKQELDIFLPDYNIAIECQGIEHFKPVTFFGGENKLKYVKDLDERKKKLCDSNEILLVYYSELNDIDYENYIGKIFNNIEKLKHFLYDTTSKKK